MGESIESSLRDYKVELFIIILLNKCFVKRKVVLIK